MRMSISNHVLLTGAVIIGFVLLAGASLAGVYERQAHTAGAASAGSGMQTVPPRTFATAIQSPSIHIIDLRTAEEFASGHIAGAFNIDFYGSDFENKIASLDRNASYAIYCHSGNRSGKTFAYMRQLGFTHVTELKGGIAAWEGSGYPITTS